MYSIPPVSVISMPNREVMEGAIRVVIDALSVSAGEPVHTLIEPEIVLRETFKAV